jgi:hypothetical protein
MIHKKNCFGRTFKQSQSNGHETDEKFYGDINSVGKPSDKGIMYALYNTCKKLKGSSPPPEFDYLDDFNSRVYTDPSFSVYSCNTFHTDHTD